MRQLSATVAGVLLVGYAGVHPSVGQGYEFSAITAVVLGGVLLGGGRGWVLSAAAGAFALELLFLFLTAVGVESTWRDTVQGLIIIAAVAVAGRAWTAGASPTPARGASTACAIDRAWTYPLRRCLLSIANDGGGERICAVHQLFDFLEPETTDRHA